MIELKRIYPECFVDTFLVKLIFQGENPSHLAGISKVAKGLKDFPDNDFIIGLIDTDKFKRDPPFIKEFTELVEDKIEAEGIIVMKVPETNKYVIRLHPAFERWVLKAALAADIDTAKYGYNSLEGIRSATKTSEIEKNTNLTTFLNEVINANPPAIQTLRYWLSKANPENN